MLKAVIFDLDGLLVDSEPLQFRAYRQAFSAYGVELAQSDWSRWHKLGASAKAWLKLHKRDDADPEAIRVMKKTLYDELIACELTLKPGAAELVHALASEGIRLAVASGSRMESIEASLNRFHLSECFEGLFSATATRRKKPHPDVYHKAMADMGLGPKDTVAIEDSPTGLRAALAASLRCVVCPDSFVQHDLLEYDGAALLVSSLSQLDAHSLERVLCP